MEKPRRDDRHLAALGEIRAFLEEQMASLHDRLEHAVELMREQTEEIGTLCDSIDEMRELFQWALNNDKIERAPSFHLTSLPRDPAAADWSARLNRVTPASFEAAAPPATEPPRDPDASARQVAQPSDEPFELHANPAGAQQQQRLW